jgi:tetratricopeptide (TPR) repeat protein
MLALCEQNLSRPFEALAAYQKLYPKSKQLYHLYQMITLYYTLKRFDEAQQSLQTILTNPEAEKQTITINTSAGRQVVSIRAAALNVQGMLFLEQNKKTEAKQAFEAAIKAAPDFILPKNNIALLLKQNP